MSVWTKSGGGDAGATLNLDISFQYKLKFNDLGKLYQKVALDYEPLVITYALDAIKNTGPLFAADDYLTNRQGIEAALMTNVSNALSDQIYCEVLDLQLRAIRLSDDFRITKLNTAIQIETNAKEQYIQESTLVQEQTSLDVLRVNNQAIETANQATATANLIKEKAIYEVCRSYTSSRVINLE